MSRIVPAVLPKSKADLDEKLALFASFPGITRVQIDVVDGRFAEPRSWPYGTEDELAAMARAQEYLPQLHRVGYEVDLMCLDAERAAGYWLSVGATRLTFHAEAIHDVPRLLASAKARYGGGVDLALTHHVSFGLALNIASDLGILEPCLPYLEYVQLMGIARIGKQGEAFAPEALARVQMLRARHPELSVQVDGGVTLAHAKELFALGVDALVVGSGIVKAENPAEAFAAYDRLQSSFAA